MLIFVSHDILATPINYISLFFFALFFMVRLIHNVFSWFGFVLVCFVVEFILIYKLRIYSFLVFQQVIGLYFVFVFLFSSIGVRRQN